MTPTKPRTDEQFTGALAELGLEGKQIVSIVTMMIEVARRRPELADKQDVQHVRECVRDTAHARMLIQGLARRWGLEKGGAS